MTYLLLVLLDLFRHHYLLVIDRHVDVRHSRGGERLDLVAQDRLVGEVDQWLRHGQRERPELIAISAD